MDIDKYNYLWENGNYDNVLIKGNIGYIIFNREKDSFLLIENETLEEQIVKRMLENGNPIYESITDLENNKNPINKVGQPGKAEDFPMKRYKLIIRWSTEVPLIIQIKKLKAVFPAVKEKTNQELLEIARKDTRWHFDTLYLDEAGTGEILQRGKEYHLDIILERDELREGF